MNYLEFKGIGHATIQDIYSMQPSLIIVLGTVLQFCKLNDLPCTLTNVTRSFPQSVSRTHPDGRAFDMSTKGWRQVDVTNCLSYVKKRVGHLGAYSKNSGAQTVGVYHNIGLGDHIHFQTKRGL